MARPIDGDTVLENICLDNCGCSPDKCRCGNVDECPIPNVHYITDAPTVSPEKEIVAQINVRVDEDEIIKRLKEDETLRAVVHGRWIEDHTDLICSVCHARYKDDIAMTYENWNNDNSYLPGLEYCPHCGAIMDGEMNNENQH